MDYLWLLKKINAHKDVTITASNFKKHYDLHLKNEHEEIKNKIKPRVHMIDANLYSNFKTVEEEIAPGVVIKSRTSVDDIARYVNEHCAGKDLTVLAKYKALRLMIDAGVIETTSNVFIDINKQASDILRDLNIMQIGVNADNSITINDLNMLVRMISIKPTDYVQIFE